MILEVKFQNFIARGRGTRRRTRVKVFIFKKFQGVKILIIFLENWHEAFFYIKEQTQKYKFEIGLFKRTILDPRKVRLWFLKKTPPPKKKICP